MRILGVDGCTRFWGGVREGGVRDGRSISEQGKKVTSSKDIHQNFEWTGTRFP